MSTGSIQHLLNTAATIAITDGQTFTDFQHAAADAYQGLTRQGYTPPTGPLPPADIPLQTGMSRNECRIVQFYAKEEATKRRPPSIVEAQEALNLSRGGVVGNLRKLVKRDLMEHTPGEARNYRTRWR